MGASQSAQLAAEDDEEEEEEEEDEDDDDAEENQRTELRGENSLVKKVLEQEPEMLPCHASASPLSPQLSSLGTPRLGPSIKVWDPYNVLAPPPPLPPPPPHYSKPMWDTPGDGRGTAAAITEVFLINHGEWHMNLRPDLVAGRCPEAALTPNGKRQARALGVFLKSQGVRFNAVYTSPLDRARATALSVCQETNLSEEQIQSCDALVEMSHGHWEAGSRSDIYTPEMLGIMERLQPDFAAPSGESLRQVEFRMVQFLNETLLRFPGKFRSDFSPPSQNDHNQEFPHHNSNSYGPSSSLPQAPLWDLVQRHHRQGIPKKKSGKSRLQIVTTMGDHEADDEMSPREPPHPQNNSLNNGMNILAASSTSLSPPSTFMSIYRVGVFTHSVPIKCLLTGLLGCSSAVSHKLCVDDSSVTLLLHSWKTGWQIKRLNDTAHLRLL